MGRISKLDRYRQAATTTTASNDAATTSSEADSSEEASSSASASAATSDGSQDESSTASGSTASDTSGASSTSPAPKAGKASRAATHARQRVRVHTLNDNRNTRARQRRRAERAKAREQAREQARPEKDSWEGEGSKHKRHRTSSAVRGKKSHKTDGKKSHRDTGSKRAGSNAAKAKTKRTHKRSTRAAEGLPQPKHHGTGHHGKTSRRQRPSDDIDTGGHKGRHRHRPPRRADLGFASDTGKSGDEAFTEPGWRTTGRDGAAGDTYTIGGRRRPHRARGRHHVARATSHNRSAGKGGRSAPAKAGTQRGWGLAPTASLSSFSGGHVSNGSTSAFGSGSGSPRGRWQHSYSSGHTSGTDSNDGKAARRPPKRSFTPAKLVGAAADLAGQCSGAGKWAAWFPLGLGIFVWGVSGAPTFDSAIKFVFQFILGLGGIVAGIVCSILFDPWIAFAVLGGVVFNSMGHVVDELATRGC